MRLRDLRRHDLERSGGGLVALSPFFGDVTAADIQSLAFRLKESAPPETVETLLMIFVAMAEYRFDDIDMTDILMKVGLKMDAIREIIEKSSVAVALSERSREEGLKQGIEIGRSEGIEAGRAQGIEAGERQGIFESIELLWSGRFTTPFPDDIKAAIDGAEIAVLRQLLREWMSLTEEQVRERLHLQG